MTQIKNELLGLLGNLFVKILNDKMILNDKIITLGFFQKSNPKKITLKLVIFSDLNNLLKNS